MFAKIEIKCCAYELEPNLDLSWPVLKSPLDNVTQFSGRFFVCFIFATVGTLDDDVHIDDDYD